MNLVLYNLALYFKQNTTLIYQHTPKLHLNIQFRAHYIKAKKQLSS